MIWIKKHEKAWDIGFEFYDLDDRAEAHIARYLLTRVVTRYLDEDN